ncbi:MAG: hypothetical protein PW789_19485 [Edaphobacter sp.]|uniref:hypothetical protein n=1 Tax=Edaphobacter sp. TaxID=1934404 RepID=UPI002385DA26|nr:hypothetical protein [Edaphobacter sp.]MDE1178763.1 hypothetical protein [Edaphobacter sp.]
MVERMTLREIMVRLGRKAPTVQAGLCTARAGELPGRYPAGERHVILAMIHCNACDVETAIITLLESHGWRDVVVEEHKQLEVPFLSEDRQIRSCYVSAVTSDGGFVVYSEPIAS